MMAALSPLHVADLVRQLREAASDLLPTTVELTVRQAAEALSLAAPFTPHEADEVFDRIIVMGGPVAAAARLVRARGALAASAARGSLPSLNAVVVVSRAELAQLLAPSLGIEASETLVAKFSERVGFPVKGDRDGALKVLELMACESGVVGVAARFAKVKLILT
jgi:hypothetical protein